ncbi:MAG: hypothetical protein AB8G77_10060 [Rhodothermales bacterium]
MENTIRHEPIDVERWVDIHAVAIIEHDEGAVADWPNRSSDVTGVSS